MIQLNFLLDFYKMDLPKDFLTKWIQLNSEKKITLDEAKLEYEVKRRVNIS